MKILIPARGGSKRIPRKNLVDFNNRPLIAHVIETALEVTDEVYVSTDSLEIELVSQTFGANTIRRPVQLATDTSTTNSVVKHFLENVKTGELIGCVQPTSPLLTSHYLKEGFKKMMEQKYDSIISVTKNTNFFWNRSGVPVNFDRDCRPRTQDMDFWYAENGAFYITTRDNFLKSNNIVNGKVGFIVMPQIFSFEIDTYEDLELVKAASSIIDEGNNKCYNV